METLLVLTFAFALSGPGDVVRSLVPVPKKAQELIKRLAKDPKRHVESLRRHIESEARRRHAHQQTIH